MLLLMLFLMACYLLVVFCVLKHFVRQVELRSDGNISQAESSYRALVSERDKAVEEKTVSEKEASEIFTLYDMTKEITKKLKEEEAFEIFRSKLKESVVFEDCRLVNASSGDYGELKDSKKYFIFTLRSKREKLGYLAIKGLSEKDAD